MIIKFKSAVIFKKINYYNHHRNLSKILMKINKNNQIINYNFNIKRQLIIMENQFIYKINQTK